MEKYENIGYKILRWIKNLNWHVLDNGGRGKKRVKKPPLISTVRMYHKSHVGLENNIYIYIFLFDNSRTHICHFSQ